MYYIKCDNDEESVKQLVTKIVKNMNGDDIKVEDCIHHGPKKFVHYVKWVK